MSKLEKYVEFMSNLLHVIESAESELETSVKPKQFQVTIFGKPCTLTIQPWYDHDRYNVRQGEPNYNLKHITGSITCNDANPEAKYDTDIHQFTVNRVAVGRIEFEWKPDSKHVWIKSARPGEYTGTIPDGARKAICAEVEPHLWPAIGNVMQDKEFLESYLINAIRQATISQHLHRARWDSQSALPNPAAMELTK